MCYERLAIDHLVHLVVSCPAVQQERDQSGLTRLIKLFEASIGPMVWTKRAVEIYHRLLGKTSKGETNRPWLEGEASIEEQKDEVPPHFISFATFLGEVMPRFQRKLWIWYGS